MRRLKKDIYLGHHETLEEVMVPGNVTVHINSMFCSVKHCVFEKRTQSSEQTSMSSTTEEENSC